MPATTFDSGSALLTLSAATAGVNSADQTNPLHRGIKVYINITALTGTTPTVTVTIRGKDPVSGTYYTILASAALTATGFTVLTVFPGAPATANVSANDQIPGTWRIEVALGGTAPVATGTISISELI